MLKLPECRSYNRSLRLAANTTGSHDVLDWFQLVLPVISGWGIVGNLLNIAVLTRQRLLSRMDRLEKSATFGLTALAISDLLFCLTVFPHCVIQHHGQSSRSLYKLYYRLYGIGAINTFLMTSTWLVVYMAVSRLIVVVFPFQARNFLSTRRALLVILLIYLTSGLMTLPFMLHLKVIPCRPASQDSPVLYEFRNRFSKPVTKSLRFYINWVWPVVADYIPLCGLFVVNVCLILELRSAATRRRHCRGHVRSSGGHRLTLTLVIIVLMLLLLVTPSEVLRLLNPYKLWSKQAHTIVSVTNILQALNFAFNFVLYCVVSASFRHTAHALLCCQHGSNQDDTDLTPSDQRQRRTNDIMMGPVDSDTRTGDVRFLTYG